MNEVIHKLQFVRPEWFYAFIPLTLYIVYALRRKRRSRSWRHACDPALLPHVLSDTRLRHSYWPLFLASLVTSLALTAMAGPVFHKLPQPVFRETSSLIIALDVSQSMDATDIKPSRLDRAKLKLLDILKMRAGGQTALLIYAADAFTVTPLTDDTATIANLVPALETALMPAQGSRADKAIAKAVALLHQSGASKGDILILTDGLHASDLDAIKNLPDKGIRLSILGFGTPHGGPIPRAGGFLKDRNGAIVIPKLQPGLLRSAARFGGGLYLNMQAGDSDTQRLSKLFNSQRSRQDSQATELTADVWREEGPWLLLLAIPLAALGMRRGWLASFICVILVAQLTSQPVYADTGSADKATGSVATPADRQTRNTRSLFDRLKLDTQFLWQRPDQKAAEALKNGDTKSAAELFQQPEWKAVAQYRAGEYDKAAKNLETLQTGDTLYNRGNALAHQQRYQDAIAAYDQALKLSPDNKDAKFNRDLVARAWQQQQQQNSSQNQQNDQQQNQKNPDQQQPQSSAEQNSPQKSQQNQQQSGNKTQNQHQGNEQPQKQNQQQAPSQKNKQSNSEQAEKSPESEQEKNNPRAAQEPSDKDPTDAEAAKQQPQADLKDQANASEDDRAAEQWLRRIPDDPGGLLRRKFIYQYGQLPNQVEEEQPW